jgi:hypothetical protein
MSRTKYVIAVLVFLIAGLFSIPAFREAFMDSWREEWNS